MFPFSDPLATAAAAEPLGALQLLVRLALAGLFGFLIAGVYALMAVSQRRSIAQSLPLLTTLVLLTMLVAMTTIVIGESIARAFGLVGALSIVRFRTVVDDTRDTSFVIFAVVVGMALGADYLLVCLIGVPLVSLAALGLSFGGQALAQGQTPERTLEVRIGAGRDPEPLLAEAFQAHLRTWKLASIISARQGAALDLVYRVRLRDASQLLPLVKSIHALEGVQSVEVKE